MFMFVCMYAHEHVYVCVCMHVYVHVYVCMYIYVNLFWVEMGQAGVVVSEEEL